ncbi:hypothetical protein Cantr_07140 [Candida viswanathii]|uniref:Uncharacterized protein n=1 Tax=Candida viswanathii TaxID=5486 RepID=A0A367Y1E7_9ASCO|nr:hypothetical protein Cantr_07140 [Candida viswanathii]
MNTSVTLQPSAINNNKQMEQNYKLALKHFINKNFPVSFTLISDLFQNAFGEFIKGTISRNLLVKIINLYLLETGVCLKEETGHLGQVQLTAALNAITSNEVSNRIRGVFGNRVPCEVLYNLHLMYVTNKEVLIADKDDYLNQLRIDYLRVDDGDKYREKFMELVVFEILPTFDEFGEAEMLISDPTKLTKLAEIKKAKQDAQDKERFKALERERAAKERKEKEMALAKEKARQSSLKYKSIKEIQKNYNEESVRKPETSGSQSTNQQLKNRLLYVYGIVQKYLKENILILLIVAVLAFGSRKYLKGVNLKDKIIETVQMAFKFSYV